MKMQRVLVSALLVASMLLGIAQMVQAKTFNHPAGFKFTVPDSWTVSKKPDVISASTAGGEVTVVFSVPGKGATLDDVVKVYGKELGKMITNMQTSKQIKKKLNGLDAVFVDGAGKLKGAGDVQFTYGVYSNGQRYLGVLILGTKAQYQKNLKTLVKILESVN